MVRVDSSSYTGFGALSSLGCFGRLDLFYKKLLGFDSPLLLVRCFLRALLRSRELPLQVVDPDVRLGELLLKPGSLFPGGLLSLGSFNTRFGRRFLQSPPATRRQRRWCELRRSHRTRWEGALAGVVFFNKQTFKYSFGDDFQCVIQHMTCRTHPLDKQGRDRPRAS